MKRKLSLLLALLLAFMLGCTAQAVVQPGEDFYYLDTADVLSEEAEGTIYFCNQLLYSEIPFCHYQTLTLRFIICTHAHSLPEYHISVCA